MGKAADKENTDLDNENLQDNVETDDSTDADAVDTDATDADDEVDANVDSDDSAIEGDGAGQDTISGEDGDAPQELTQQQFDSVVLKRTQKLNKKIEIATDAAQASNADLVIANEKNKILELQNQQLKEGKKLNVEPNPDDFDDGKDSLEYKKQLKEFTTSQFRKIVQEEIAVTSDVVALETQQANKVARSEANMTAHYENVKKAKIPKYFDHEDVAIEILGNDAIKEIIDNFEDDSHLLLNYLGTSANKEEAEALKHLIDTNQTVKAVTMIGKIIGSKLTRKPSATQTAPDPDDEVTGGNASDGGRLHRQLDRLRDEAVKTRKMDKVMAFRRKHKL